MSEDKKFGKLRLSVQGTTNGRAFDILYDFRESMVFVEFTSKKEFYFIQPWMQFPSQKYSDECKLVSIELVSRFNQHEELLKSNTFLEKEMVRLRHERDRWRDKFIATTPVQAEVRGE